MTPLPTTPQAPKSPPAPTTRHDDDGPDAIAALLRGSDRFVLTGHAPLDGDGLGSALGLCRSLRLAGKTAHVVSDAPVPSTLRWLPGASEVIAWTPGAYTSIASLAEP